ncbi:MAG TPA: serine acetyltransferase [Polyangia bacterium]
MARALGLMQTLREDIRAKAHWNYGQTGPRDMVRALLSDGTAAVVLYRLMQASHHIGLVPAEMLFNKMNTIFGQCIVGRGAEFGPGLVLIHSQGVVINGAVHGGRNLHIEHQVTIGAEKGKSPHLGDNIFIGCGAKIVGPVTIGDGSRVGANAVVLHDVPAGTTVVGIPAKPVERKP